MEAYADWRWEVAYQGFSHAITHRLTGEDGQIRYLKIAHRTAPSLVPGEALRMRWAREYLPVPEVLGSGSDDGVDWLLTGALPGRDATDPALRAHPEALVRTLARGLRRFHDAPAARCPFDAGLERLLAVTRERLAAGLILPGRDFHEEHSDLTAEAAVRRLEATRPDGEDRVVCHGDYCLPNVMISGGEAVGFLDLGELGVADRWWDLAVATWSVTWNLGPGHEDAFLAAYGVEPDPERTAWYRLLYDVVS